MRRRPLASPLAAACLLVATAGCDAVDDTAPAPPLGPAVTLLPVSPGDDDALTVALLTPGRVADGEPTYRYRWLRNDEDQADLSGAATVPADRTAVGDRWVVEVRAVDARGQTSAAATAQATVSGAAVLSVTLAPETPGDDDAIVATAALADGTDVTGAVAWTWYRSGALADVHDATVPADESEPGEVWTAVATSADGASATASRQVTCGLTAVPALSGPIYPDSIVEPSAYAVDEHGASATVDGYACRFLLDGVAIDDDDCSIDGADWGFRVGQQLAVEMRPRLRGGTCAPGTTAAVEIDDPPVLFVTEMVSGNVVWIDSTTGQVTTRLPLPRPDFFVDTADDGLSTPTTELGMPMQARWDPTGTKLWVTSSTYGVIWEIDPVSRSIVNWVSISGQIYWVVTSEDGSEAWITDMDRNGLVKVRTSDWTQLGQVVTGEAPMAFTINDDGLAFVPHHHEPWVSVVDSVTMTHVTDLLPITGSYWAQAGPDPSLLWIVAEQEDAVELWSLPGLEYQAEIPVGDLPNYVAFVEGGKTAFVTNFDSGTVSVIDVAGRLTVDTLPADYGAVYVLMRPDNRYFYVCNLKGETITVYDARTYALLDTWEGILGPRMAMWVER